MTAEGTSKLTRVARLLGKGGKRRTAPKKPKGLHDVAMAAAPELARSADALRSNNVELLLNAAANLAVNEDYTIAEVRCLCLLG